MSKPLREQELLKKLDAHTAHADELAKPLPEELEPLERLKGSVKRYDRPFDGCWETDPEDTDVTEPTHGDAAPADSGENHREK
jgi:antitoxin VapB